MEKDRYQNQLKLELVIQDKKRRADGFSDDVLSEMRVQIVFTDGKPHVEFCGTSRADASEADISALFDKAKAAAIAAMRSLDGDGGNGAVSDDAGGDPFRRSVMRKFTRTE